MKHVYTILDVLTLYCCIAFHCVILHIQFILIPNSLMAATEFGTIWFSPQHGQWDPCLCSWCSCFNYLLLWYVSLPPWFIYWLCLLLLFYSILSRICSAISLFGDVFTCFSLIGPSDAPLAPTPFEAFVKVPKFLRPHTQIYCTRFDGFVIPPPSQGHFLFFFFYSSFLVRLCGACDTLNESCLLFYWPGEHQLSALQFT